ncbi:hypothetical protein QYM36_007432 [Artemia franciscana]|uniref:Transmembrane protein 186 n=1 Tax=Artemia franciscana TaxID=6661 RepID=A0AA88I987_ARTSF|nr:hypothetical protein QYM36_007432 [Artemia franciscana]KAK2726581.1 hypothetical protein QYM36_007432 [Artemia franciscana]KAK2726582.1 hypothetical protein QYM36_007432 [Artemia franciscana]KAK2726583.1 hypothetical protein QYM36_007432 [Artemia franciscana]
MMSLVPGYTYCRLSYTVKHALRSISTTPLLNKKQGAVDLDNYTPIYKFKYIRAARLLCRLKLYQTGLTIASIPLVNSLSTQGLVNESELSNVVVISVIALGMLGVMGELCRKLIGFMYIDKSGENLRVAHLTFFGNRRDIIIPVNDVVLVEELPDELTDIYIRMRTYSNKYNFLFTLRFGEVLDVESFKKVFGKVS